MINKDLGMATAYAYAVSQGYTGTEEEFAELMASYASVAQEAGTARDEAVSAKDTAVNAVEGFEDTVETETATAVQTIQNEGSAQVTAIRAEGATQVTAVQGKGNEVLDSIPADYTQLSQDVNDLKSDFDDISEILVGKDSLIPLSKFTYADGGVSVTRTTDSMTLDMTTTNTYAGDSITPGTLTNYLEIGETYRIHAKVSAKTGSPAIRVAVRGISGNPNGTAAAVTGENVGDELVLDFTVDSYMSRITFFVSMATSTKDSSVTYSEIWIKKINPSAIDLKSRNETELLNLETIDIDVPDLRNGSAGNEGNTTAVCMKYLQKVDSDFYSCRVQFIGDKSKFDQFAFAYATFKGASDGMTTSDAVSDASITKYYYNAGTPVFSINDYKDVILQGNFDHIAFFVWGKKNGADVPMRVATEQHSIKITFLHASDVGDVKSKMVNAKHIVNNAATPLTLLHFSDIHADTGALKRITYQARRLFEGDINDMICTGDIAGNVASQITSWWDEDVLTCIGNHDTASYSVGSGYDWTALSMADRDAYYIAPFESEWGITHTAGTSYYYKDYSAQKVRMIVMDVMLYNDNGAEATAQTAWLESLLADAITNNLHTLIAIHCPHGGAIPKECSFSRYGQGTMPTLTDCNTPQVVVDAVSSAIANGLKFIGYLVGHTHQDNVWDVLGDKSQLMYCITCAAVSYDGQWMASDMFRDSKHDAFNIVCIDTAHTLVKLIRGGGADIDNHMRTRKAICFDYSTGEVVGEVL